MCKCVLVCVLDPTCLMQLPLTLSLQSNRKACSVVVCITLDTGISERLTGTELVLSWVCPCTIMVGWLRIWGWGFKLKGEGLLAAFFI